MGIINDIKIAEYFSLYEFECPCCRRVMLSPDLLARIDHLRRVINRPIYINTLKPYFLSIEEKIRK